ncbi:MAG TPA: dTDP-4-dehydrorhamnose 3,5-epimerase [Sphingopyxis sp.]|uniref:dTDP-4-dehydrorhamnose 3,5-epimerase n=1 Tax=Sphingopyxis sp. TaxID=1908224 RepID=UPI002BBBCCBE|nr:dTDP-4-dehydrorhamnose 3,5-epimerase [Sphingopyxis sp.]HWW58620.1 dTDP-4-dehydrorhamnose 3,5-epimerase [Sphingopyxis sp.]
MMEIYEPIPGLKLVTPDRHGDHRGFFCETWNRRSFKRLGIDIEFVQDNISFSAQAGTVRGLHYQSPPHAQAKLVRCGRGRLFDVAVDIRTGSPTYGKWFGIELSSENARQLLIPAGFLHGFITQEADTEISYKCSDYYAPEAEGTVRWNDPAIGIEWPLSGHPVLSTRDAEASPLHDLESPFIWEGDA